jgi:hypothetical protein
MYSSAKYGIRLTDSGSVFLLEVLPSYSFYAAMFCNEEKPLFFIKDATRISYILETVYDSANCICRHYETQASLFCNPSETLKMKTYLPVSFGTHHSYRSMVKVAHMEYLDHYKRFVLNYGDTFGFDSNTKSELIDNIHYYHNQYKEWITGSKSPECF